MYIPWRKSREVVVKRRQPKHDSFSNRLDESKKLFQRNATLVGSSSSSVASTNEYNGNLRSPRAHVHHLNSKRRRIFILLAYVITSGIFTFWLLYEFTAEINIKQHHTSVETVHKYIDNTARYKTIINDYLNAHPVERLRFMVHVEDLINYMSSDIPEVKRIEVLGSSNPATTEFALEFRKPVASWLISGKQYYVDKDGVSFEVNYFERPLVKIEDKSGVPQASGTAVVSGRFLRFIGRTVETARGLGMVVDKVSIPSGSTRQIEISVMGHNFPIKLSLDRPVGEQVEDMNRSIVYLDSKKIQPQYIDVRVSGKAFYKL